MSVKQSSQNGIWDDKSSGISFRHLVSKSEPFWITVSHILAVRKWKAGRKRQCSHSDSQCQTNAFPFSCKQGFLQMNSNIFEEAICRKTETDLYEYLLSPWFSKCSIILHELFVQVVSVEQKSRDSTWRDWLLTLTRRHYHFSAEDLVQYNSWCQSNLSKCLQENVEDFP